MTSGLAALHEHPLRRLVVGEMHLRRWPELAAPSEIVQFLRVIPAEIRQQEVTALGAWRQHESHDGTEEQRSFSGKLPGGASFTWERHTEASTLTLFFVDDAEPSASQPRSITRRAEQLPGEVLRATRIFVLGNEAAALSAVDTLGMESAELVSCHTQAGARIWSDFRIGPDGYGRLVVAANGLEGADLSRLVQRLQELGNYRNLALLGLPVAQESWALLNGLEVQLSTLARDVAHSDTTDDELLARVTALSLELMGISTRTGFRMNATAAYAQLVEERLGEIAPRRIQGCQSLSDFTARRLLPAVRTCAVHSARAADLSQRAERFTALLRTRIETRIENQNAKLLQSMQRSSELQLRLQQLVEGLSVVALSYYSLGLLAYVLKGMGGVLDSRTEAVVLAVATPAIILVSVLAMKILRSRFMHRV